MRKVMFGAWCLLIVAGIAYGWNAVAERREAEMAARLNCRTDLECCTAYHDCWPDGGY